MAIVLIFALAFSDLASAISIGRNNIRPPAWPDHYTLNITHGVAAPDGVSRPVFLINGRTPGPTLHAYQDKQICVSRDEPSFRRIIH